VLASHAGTTLVLLATLPPKGMPAAPNNRATWTGDHFPPRAAGIPRSSRPAAMAAATCLRAPANRSIAPVAQNRVLRSGHCVYAGRTTLVAMLDCDTQPPAELCILIPKLRYNSRSVSRSIIWFLIHASPYPQAHSPQARSVGERGKRNGKKTEGAVNFNRTANSS
jgi:hypothetical protein